LHGEEFLKSEFMQEMTTTDTFFRDKYRDEDVGIQLFENPHIDLNLSILDLLRHQGIFGMTGTGKTNTLAVMLEELAEKNIAFSVFDLEGSSFVTIPEEYKNVEVIELKPLVTPEERRRLMIEAGDNQRKLQNLFVNAKSQELNLYAIPDAMARLEEVKQLAHENFCRRKKSVITLGDFLEVPQKHAVIYTYFWEIWNICDRVRKDHNLSSPHVLVLDEAHRIFPKKEKQKGIYGTSWSSHIAGLVDTLFTAGRKRKLFGWVASQSPGKVDDSATSQMETSILHKVKGKLDIDKYKQILEGAVDDPGVIVETIEDLQNYKTGRVVYTHKGRAWTNLRVFGRCSRHLDRNVRYHQDQEEAAKVEQLFNAGKIR
jgi:hypothetical protein